MKIGTPIEMTTLALGLLMMLTLFAGVVFNWPLLAVIGFLLLYVLMAIPVIMIVVNLVRVLRRGHSSKIA